MEIRYPELKKRLQSTFIDILFMIGLMFISGMILDRINPSQEEDDGIIRAVIFVSIWGIYEPVCTSLGCTLGNYLIKIRVRRYGNVTKRIDIFRAFFRFVVKFLLGWLSFLTISGNKERRAIHDFVADSVMIEK